MKTFQTNKSKPREYYVKLGVYKIHFLWKEVKDPRGGEVKEKWKGKGKEKKK